MRDVVPFTIESIDEPIRKAFFSLVESEAIDGEEMTHGYRPFYAHYEREYYDLSQGTRGCRSSRR